ncbi:hypothetical protein AB6A40_000773 [Gnathostoma spinigerum]|uniref:Uncharacterized protein n=1 Tax=Gnathostoma spinigerum TaxID=75299 RepID=A0ABD6E7B9_9BILA
MENEKENIDSSELFQRFMLTLMQATFLEAISSGKEHAPIEAKEQLDRAQQKLIEEEKKVNSFLQVLQEQNDILNTECDMECLRKIDELTQIKDAISRIESEFHAMFPDYKGTIEEFINENIDLQKKLAEAEITVSQHRP